MTSCQDAAEELIRNFGARPFVKTCRAPLKDPPCLKEREACIQCYKANADVSATPPIFPSYLEAS